MKKLTTSEQKAAVKELVEGFMSEFTEYKAVASEELFTMSLEKSDTEYRCVKCGQLLGREQRKCPCCKRDVKMYVTPDQHAMFSSLVEEDIKPEDILINVAILKKPRVNKVLVALGVFIIAYSIIHLIAQFV